MTNRPIYCVEITTKEGVPCALFENYSVNKAVSFLSTVNRDICQVNFYRHRPFKVYDVDSILEVIKE